MDEHIPLDAYNIEQFCKAHGLSRSSFYVMHKAGDGPRVFKVGRRTLISREAATDWRREMERKTAKAAKEAA